MTISKPTGVVAGDVIVIFCACGLFSSGPVTVYTGGTFSNLFASDVAMGQALLWRTADGTEGSSFGLTGFSGGIEAHCMAFSGAAGGASFWDPNTPAAATSNNQSSGSTISFAGLENSSSKATTVDGDMLLWLVAAYTSSSLTMTYPAGFTGIDHTNNFGGNYITISTAYNTQTTHGTTGTVSGSFSGPGPSWAGTLVALAASPPPFVSGTASLALGPLTLTAAGTITAGGTVTGTASVALGPLSLAATGTISAPPPPTILAGWSEWSWYLLQPDGTFIESLITATARKLTFQLDGPATAGFTMSGEVDETQQIVELSTDIYVARNGRAMFRGRVGGSTENHSATQTSGDFTAFDYRGMLDHRVFWPGSTLTFTGMDESNIAWTIINDTQALTAGNMGVTRGTGTTTGILRDRDYTAGDSLAQAISDMGKCSGGFDWEIDPLLKFNLYYPQRGSDRSAQPLVYGKEIVAFTSTLNVDQYANAVYYTGSSGTTTPVATVGSIPAGIGLWQTQKSDPNLIAQSTVNEQALGELNYDSSRVMAFSVTLAPDLWDPATFWLGDTVRLIIRTGRFDIDVTRRIIQIDVTLEDNRSVETVVLSVGAAPRRVSDRFTNLNHRVSALELAPGIGSPASGGGGGSGGYASLTGAGQTTTPGDLVQAGGLEVDSGSSNIILHSVAGYQQLVSGGGIYIQDGSISTGVQITANNGIIVHGSGTTSIAGHDSEMTAAAPGGTAKIYGATVNIDTPLAGHINIAPTSGGQIGFYGATPTTAPVVTGSKGGNAALASLLTGLVQLGLIVDTTT